MLHSESLWKPYADIVQNPIKRCHFLTIPLAFLKVRSSHQEGFLGKGILKIYRKFTGEHPCQGVISMKLLSNFLEITLRHRYSPVNLLHIFRTPFPKNTSGRLLLKSASWVLYNFHQTEIETENDGLIFLKQKSSCQSFLKSVFKILAGR